MLKQVFNFSASLGNVDAPEAVDLPSVFELNKCKELGSDRCISFKVVFPSSNPPSFLNTAALQDSTGV